MITEEMKKDHYNIMNCYNASNKEEIERFLKKYMLFEQIYSCTPDGDIEYIEIIIYDKKENNFKKYSLKASEYDGYYSDYQDLCYTLDLEITDFDHEIITIKEMAKEIQLRKGSIENYQYDDFVELYKQLLLYEDINLLKQLEKETRLIEFYYNNAIKNKNSHYFFKIDKENMEILEKIKKTICD